MPDQELNRLGRESSPYLRQHARNPVDWYPWGEEALELARREDRPIFLSIGYSACHWCHVMERESFEDAEIARRMNERFVNIKVDREERPDIDRIYMSAVQMITGTGGWPLSVFLTPDRKPFYGGTYFPPEDRHGMPGFPRVLEAVADAYRTRRAEIESSAQKISARLQELTAVRDSTAILSPELIGAAARGLAASFDPDHGGFGERMKFPQPMALQLLLRHWRRAHDLESLQMVRKTLSAMADGGIYDHIGGGFHRYATDPRWLIPHFEKMLYDNALLAVAYIEGWQATGEESYARVARETLAYIRRDLASPEGGFYSTQDADVGEDEGSYYLWTPSELREALGEADADLFARAYGVDEAGDFEGRSILHRVKDDATLSELFGGDPRSVAGRLAEAQCALHGFRDRRPKPGRDEKILADWNGLAISAFARGARASGKGQYRDVAQEAARFVLTRMAAPDGRLYHSHKDGSSRVPGFLSDYANLIVALIDLYEADGDPAHIHEAVRLRGIVVEDFTDPDGGFYDTSVREGGDLIARTREATDGATPSGNVMAAIGMTRLARILGEPDGLERSERTLRSFAGMMQQIPSGMTQMLVALDLYIAPSREIVVVGPAEDERTRRLLETVDRRFLPHAVLMRGDGSTPGDLPGLQGKAMIAGSPAAYVCEGFVCRAPVTSPQELAAQLG